MGCDLSASKALHVTNDFRGFSKLETDETWSGFVTESENFGMICGKDGEREDRLCVSETILFWETESDPLNAGTGTELLIEQIILKIKRLGLKINEKKAQNSNKKAASKYLYDV